MQMDSYGKLAAEDPDQMSRESQELRKNLTITFGANTGNFLKISWSSTGLR